MSVEGGSEEKRDSAEVVKLYNQAFIDLIEIRRRLDVLVAMRTSPSGPTRGDKRSARKFSHIIDQRLAGMRKHFSPDRWGRPDHAWIEEPEPYWPSAAVAAAALGRWSARLKRSAWDTRAAKAPKRRARLEALPGIMAITAERTIWADAFAAAWLGELPVSEEADMTLPRVRDRAARPDRVPDRVLRASKDSSSSREESRVEREGENVRELDKGEGRAEDAGDARDAIEPAQHEYVDPDDGWEVPVVEGDSVPRGRSMGGGV